MSEYRRVEESFGESSPARQAGLPAGPGLGASNTRRRFWATAIGVALRGVHVLSRRVMAAPERRTGWSA